MRTRMASIVRVCPSCGSAVIITVPQYVKEAIVYGAPLSDLDYKFSEKDKTKLETGMCDMCQEESNQAIEAMLKGSLNGD